MKGGLWWLCAAAAVYLVALGCAVSQPDGSLPIRDTGSGLIDADNGKPSTARYEGLPFRGMTLPVQHVEDPKPYFDCIDTAVSLGADTIELVVDSRQETVNSDTIYIDVRYSPTIEKLTQIIKYAKSDKDQQGKARRPLRVVVMAIVLLDRPQNSDWRGVIEPRSWDDWFISYREMEKHYATAAADGNADVFVVGSELVSAERYVEEWLHTIHEVRKIFHGLITYSANWDHYRSIPFWDHVDIISTNSYYVLGGDRNVTVPEIIKRWQAIQGDLLPWVRKQHKPFMFTEVGWCSIANAANEPWDYTKETIPIDLDLQKKLYEGFFKAWYGKRELGGFMMWQLAPNTWGNDDRGYTPVGKPAEQVLRHWMSLGPWHVNTNP